MIDISVSGVVKEFEVGKKILDGLTFQVDSGERVGLLGPNGCGKTTLLRILTGVVHPDEGEVVIAPNRRLGLISQIPVYPAGHTVEDVLRSAFRRLEGLAKEMEALAARLTMNGAEGLVMESEEDFKTFLEQNRQYWDYVDDALLERMRGVARIKFYVTDDEVGKAQMTQALAGVKNPVSTAPVKEEDWASGWQKYYQPMPVGEKVYIVPEWERGKPVPDGRTAVYLNPGLTFGTGSHASTQLCLTLLEKHLQPRDGVLDLGCGSGILSIAALCLGAKSAIAVDIDPKAVDVAYENAALNGIGRDRYTVRAGNVLADRALAAELAQKRYHLVLANIVADVIIPLAPPVPGLLEEDGVFLCSGIIDARAHEVEAALKQAGLTVTQKREKNGWAALEAVRSTP